MNAVQIRQQFISTEAVNTLLVCSQCLNRQTSMLWRWIYGSRPGRPKEIILEILAHISLTFSMSHPCPSVATALSILHVSLCKTSVVTVTYHGHGGDWRARTFDPSRGTLLQELGYTEENGVGKEYVP